MKHKIQYSKEALHDLDEIWDYTASELQSPIAADRIVNSIMDAVNQLADFAEARVRLLLRLPM